LTDFAYVSNWVTECPIISQNVRNHLLKNEVLRRCEGVGQLLLRHPGEAIAMRKRLGNWACKLFLQTLFFCKTSLQYRYWKVIKFPRSSSGLYHERFMRFALLLFLRDFFHYETRNFFNDERFIIPFRKDNICYLFFQLGGQTNTNHPNLQAWNVCQQKCMFRIRNNGWSYAPRSDITFAARNK